MPQTSFAGGNDILYEYYSAIKPGKEDDYCVQSLKSIRAGINRYFRKNLGVDIAKDAMFVTTYEIFKEMVEFKYSDKGLKHPIPPFRQTDLYNLM